MPRRTTSPLVELERLKKKHANLLKSYGSLQAQVADLKSRLNKITRTNAIFAIHGETHQVVKIGEAIHCGGCNRCQGVKS